MADVSEGRRKVKIKKVARKASPKKGGGWLGKFVGVVLGLIVVGGALLFFLLPRASVVIKPRLETVSVSLNSLPDSKLRSFESSVEGRFSATGRFESQNFARGKILIFNEFKKISLIPSRFESANGLIFFSEEKVTLNGPTTEDGELVPGVTEVSVVAEGPGPLYNIGAASFVLPALREAKSPRYNLIYGLSESAMTGGSEAGVNVVSSSDVGNSRSELLEEAWGQFQKSLSNNEILVFRNGSEELFFETSIPEGEEALAFNASLEIVLEGMVLSEAEAEAMILIEAGDDYEIVPKSLEIKNGKPSAQIFKKVDPLRLAKALSGMTQEEARKFLLSQDNFDSIEINFWPLWVKNFPENAKTLDIKVEL